MADVIEDFYGVYLLFNVSDKYKGRTYIGFTVNPNRRISQHNKGVRSGGARKTSCKGPWEMVLIIHGFPNEISALRFEWAWQNPKKSRRLRHLAPKKVREKTYDFTLRTLFEMLRTGPWNRLPLTIRWLNDKYSQNFPATSLPPLHMPIAYGRVTIKKLREAETDDTAPTDHGVCFRCRASLCGEDLMACVNPKCNVICHVICFSMYFIRNRDDIIPIEGECPSCYSRLLWGDLVRKKKGCYKNLIEDTENFSDYSNSDIENLF